MATDRTDEQAAGRGPAFAEFVVLMALMISLVALSIDAMLPALGDIGRDLGVAAANDTQLVVSVLLLGLGLGQMVYGPVSDSIGRKPAIYAGVALYILGCGLAVLSQDFATMLAGRLLQGLGAAGPRSVIVAVVRDRYQGRAMARIMSLVMAVFILVPVLAPILGQGVMAVAHWRWIFGLLLALALVGLVWFALRQPETLRRERRRPFSPLRVALAVREVVTHRAALGHTVAGGIVFGAFVGYLNTSAQVFKQTYGLGDLFPFYFGGLALAIGAASYVNSRLVMRFGMRLLSVRAQVVLIAVSVAFVPVAALAGGVPPLWATMAYMAVSFFCIGLLMGNLQALAMEHLGHIAGTAAAVVGSLQTLLSVVLGILVGRAYDGTVLPLVVAFAVLGALSLAVTGWAGRPPSPRSPSSTS
ncbi:MAG: multidrug effflux MFS transporter [Hyphomicrobiales bacterium]|nr:multidrug effflux MFS transporter [Hyphomicrobiales bacterium]